MMPFRRGFTLIEVMVVLAVIAILALMAMPSMQGRLVREQIVEAARFADFAKAPVAQAWRTTASLPADNAAAGLPEPHRIVSNHVASLTVEDGALHIVFGNQANGALRGKTLSLRPGVVEDSPVVPVAWVCGHAAPPEPMVARGADRTDIERRFLPRNCQGPATP
jgi:type IV pilus assembly protein PilA